MPVGQNLLEIARQSARWRMGQIRKDVLRLRGDWGGLDAQLRDTADDILAEVDEFETRLSALTPADLDKAPAQ